MKKVLIIGANLPMLEQVEKAAENQDVTIVINNHEVKDNMRQRYLEENILYEVSPKFTTTTTLFEKSKSKFHK